VSWARNAAIRAASSPILAFMDDDQDVEPDWLVAIAEAFRAHPDVDVIGGRVLPRWIDPPPDWISRDIWGPVSIIDRGPEPFRVSRSRWMCLPGGNMAWRRDALLALGGYSVEYARTEDRELLVRHLLAGGQAMYVPSMVVHHRLEGHRLTRAFFKSWYRLEGRTRAGYAFEELLTADGGLAAPSGDTPQILGVARYLYREWLHVLASYLAATLTFRRADALRAEGRLLLLSSYIRRRIELTATPEASPVHRIGAAAVRSV
jgi:glycosyltransferase involved in cell wall biosynthesis